MAKTLRVRTKTGWVTKPIENTTENRLSAGEVDDNFLALESDIENRQKVYDSVSDMVADATLTVGRKVRTLGYYTPGDGGGNDYEIVAAATGTDDGGSFIDLTGISGQAKGLFVDRVINVKQFGAVGDDTDDTTSINSAVDYDTKLYWPEGIYVHTDKIVLGGKGVHWVGDGSTKTVLKFTNPTITAALERINKVGSQWKMHGIRIDGTDKTFGTERHGIFSEVDVGTPGGVNPSYDLDFKDVSVERFSGDGFHITDWFQQSYFGCYARYIGRDGFVIAGDQSTTFINSQNFNLDIGGNSWWFQGGNPFLQGLNSGNVFTGLRLGRPSSHPRGVSYARAQLMSINIEPLYAGGTGIHVHNGSSFAICDRVLIYSPKGVVNAAYGIYFENVADVSFFLAQPNFIKYDGTYADFDHKLYLSNVSGNSFLFSLQPMTGVVSGATQAAVNRLIDFSSNSSAELKIARLAPSVYFKNSSAYLVAPKTFTSNVNVRRDSGDQDDHVMLLDATSNNITVSLDYATYLPDRVIEIKRTDSSAYTVTIASLTPDIDGQANISLPPLGYTKLVSSDGRWHILS